MMWNTDGLYLGMLVSAADFSVLRCQYLLVEWRITANL